MVCAAPWKTCNCPWFNHAHLDEDDRLNDMRVPYHDVVEVVEMPTQPDPGLLRRASTRSRRRPERERELDRADDILAAHLHAQLRMDGAPTASELHRADPVVGVYGLGNSGGHHMNESYTVRPLATAAARTATRSAAPRSFFGSRRPVREVPRDAPRPQPVQTAVQTARASAMAGLSRDGSKRGANRVGTWLNHVLIDEEAIHTAPRDVEVDDWRVEGSVRGID
jgi:ariadne-1